MLRSGSARSVGGHGIPIGHARAVKSVDVVQLGQRGQVAHSLLGARNTDRKCTCCEKR